MKRCPEYRVWVSMRRRCRDRKREDFKYYGARGIKVCERWASFENFLADMGARPGGTSLDRIDNDGDYTPGNCRWATAEQQRRNQRRTRTLRYGDRTLPLAEWSAETGIPFNLLRQRVRRGWSAERALNAPKGGGA